MHAAPAHLESKLRFWDFTVGQIAAAFAGIMLGFTWARFVSPLHGMLGASVATQARAVGRRPDETRSRPYVGARATTRHRTRCDGDDGPPAGTRAECSFGAARGAQARLVDRS